MDIVLKVYIFAPNSISHRKWDHKSAREKVLQPDKKNGYVNPFQFWSGRVLYRRYGSH